MRRHDDRITAVGSAKRSAATALVALAALAVIACERREPAASGDTDPGVITRKEAAAAGPMAGRDAANQPGSTGATPGGQPVEQAAGSTASVNPTTGTPKGIAPLGGSGTGAGNNATGMRDAASERAQPATGSAAGATGMAAAGGGTTGAPAGERAAGTLTRAEKSFVVQAAAHGLYEVQVGQLAADKARKPAVQAHARRLVADHRQANQALREIAARHEVPLPDTLPAEQQAKLDKLAAADGEAFDRQYVQTVGIKDHQADIRTFENAARDVSNPQLKAWIAQTLPTLKDHLAHAQKLPADAGG